MSERSTKPSRPRSFGERLSYPWMKVRWTLEAFEWRRSYHAELAAGRASASPGPLEVVLVLDHLKPRANAGKLVRSADAMGAAAVHTVGMPYFNPRPAVDSMRNVPVHTHAGIDACFDALRKGGYRIFALEPERDVAQRTYLDATSLPKKCALVVGHESRGVSFTAEAQPDVVWLSIRQYGVVPCMNASVAGSIALYEYARQHGPR